MSINKTLTSEKQIKANQANSKKSTGATTKVGKLAVASNAVKHGLFAQRLILPDENYEEYAQLIEGLVNTLNPVGTLEQLLVEKIALATWKQLRLIRAENASIELDRRIDLQSNRTLISNAIGRENGEADITMEDFLSLDVDRDFINWCNEVHSESSTLNTQLLNKNEFVKLKKQGPFIYAHLLEEAELGGYELKDYVDFINKDDEKGMYFWYLKVIEWIRKELATFNRKDLIQTIGQQVKAKFSAPFNNELLLRYQAGIDNELYKAIDALRKQQFWRVAGSTNINNEVD